MDNPYFVLGISRSATDKEIHDVYRALTREAANDGTAASPDQRRAIDDAYDALHTTPRRAMTDAALDGAFADLRNAVMATPFGRLAVHVTEALRPTERWSEEECRSRADALTRTFQEVREQLVEEVAAALAARLSATRLGATP